MIASLKAIMPMLSFLYQHCFPLLVSAPSIISSATKKNVCIYKKEIFDKLHNQKVPINGDSSRTPTFYFLLTSSMHHPKILAIFMFSSVCSSTGASNLYDIGTANPRFILPPSILYWRH